MAGYRAAGVDRAKFGIYGAGSQMARQGYALDRFADVRGKTGRVNPAYSSMIGSQGQWRAANSLYGRFGARTYEVPVGKTGRVADAAGRVGRTPTFSENKVGSSFNRGQAKAYSTSGQRMHMTFMPSPLSNNTARMNSNTKAATAIASRSNGRMTVGQLPGPTQRAVTTMQATSKVNTALRGVSRVAVPVGVAVDTYRLGSSISRNGFGRETRQVAGDVAGGWSGAAAGGVAGAKAGAVIGTFVGGPVGTAVGTVAGGLVGAVGGSLAGSALGRAVGGWFGSGSAAPARSAPQSTPMASVTGRTSGGILTASNSRGMFARA